MVKGWMSFIKKKSYLTFVHFFDGHFSAYHFPLPLKGILLMFQADDEVEYWKQGGQGPRIPKGMAKNVILHCICYFINLLC